MMLLKSGQGLYISNMWPGISQYFQLKGPDQEAQPDRNGDHNCLDVSNSS